jgi:hypothetical protein
MAIANSCARPSREATSINWRSTSPKPLADLDKVRDQVLRTIFNGALPLDA